MKKTISQSLKKVVGLLMFTGLTFSVSAQFTWSSAGPVYAAGRIRNMIVDKNDPSGKTLYVGATSSGIFKSTDAGSNWAPINDQGFVRNISYMAQSVDGSIWASTGEGFLRYGQKAKAQKGTGLYKLNTTTNELVKVQDSAVVGDVINRIACSPIDNKFIAVASNKGIMVSTDGGTSFSAANLSGYTPTVNVSFGMDVKFDANGILYCTIGNERGHIALAGLPNFVNVASKVFKSSDASLGSFTNITPVSSVFADLNYGRIELGISPSNPNVVYASIANKNTSLPGSTQVPNSASWRGIFVSYNGGTSWALLKQGSASLDPLSSNGIISSGDYAHVLLVNPTNPNQLYIGSYSFYIFNRSGGTDAAPIGDWVQVGFSIPAIKNTPYFLNQNIHDIKIVPGNPIRFYFITDAGIYRSSDLVGSSNIIPPTFQPFYKGLVTGQFNSVSIERFPLANVTTPSGSTVASPSLTSIAGSSINPFSGFIGGTGANGLTYYSGQGTNLVSSEVTYMSGDVYNAEFSKLLNGAAIISQGNGDLYRTANAVNSSPVKYDINSYSGALSKLSPSSGAFANAEITTGTPFKLWENYGQISNSPDKVYFYNDTIRFPYSFTDGVANMITQTTFSFSANRPNRFAKIDSIAIRTATVTIEANNSLSLCPIAFIDGDKQDIRIKLPKNYTVTSGVLTPTAYGPASGPATITLDGATGTDIINVKFNNAPFASKTATIHTTSSATITNPSGYYRVFATIFYKYKAGDSVSVTDNNISTKTNVYTTTLSVPLNWDYTGTLPSYTLSATVNTAITSPTFVLNPGNIIQPGNSIFTVSPQVRSTYTVSTFGTYSLTAPIVQHTLVASTNTAITSPTYILLPDNISQSTTTFVVNPSTTTNYTISEVGTGTLTNETYSTIVSSTYELNPGNVTQTTNVFVVSPTVTTNYTLTGISSDTVTGLSTSASSVGAVGTATASANTNTAVPFCVNNLPVKITSRQSARLAMALSYQPVTGNGGNNRAIVVSKAPLNLNDPLNFVRISQSGCLSDEPNGAPSQTTTISIAGKATLLEWSKSGTELYYATDDNKLYRVSHITDIMDLSASSYSGKFYTDIFSYASPVNANTLNPVSPYRTTLIGSFDKPITSISVTNDDKFIALTFNNPTQTGTTGIVMYNSVDSRSANISNIGWTKKDDITLKGNVTYCSLMEKTLNKIVFVGTDNGMYFTNDITSASPVWKNVNDGVSVAGNKLPNVQVFDIKQQTLDPWDCYNSGQIYVATNGRGVWTTSNYLVKHILGIDETTNEWRKNENSLGLFPNPSNGNVTLAFDAIDGESATMSIFDLSGRNVANENLGKLNGGEQNYNFNTSALNPGIYIVTINSTSNVKRVSKLVVSK